MKISLTYLRTTLQLTKVGLKGKTKGSIEFNTFSPIYENTQNTDTLEPNSVTEILTSKAEQAGIHSTYIIMHYLLWLLLSLL